MSITVKELLVLKGYPEDYISDDLDIPEDAKYRMIDNSPDVNMYSYILSRIPIKTETSRDLNKDKT